MQNGEDLNLEVNPNTRPVHCGEGLLDCVAHKVIGAPTIASEHDGKGAQMGNDARTSDRIGVSGPQIAALVIAFPIT
jgi:hypothetical protein